jgi:putative ATP-dependent endonuclease of the OLD family
MKIVKIQISNFRSLEDVTLYPSNVLSIVGRNNTGKSNILQALQLFFSGSVKSVTAESFFNEQIDKPIEVWIKFSNLSEWEKEQFDAWIDEDGLTVGRRISVEGEDNYSLISLAKIKVPTVDWLNQDKITGENIKSWWENRDNLRVNNLNFGELLGDKRPTVGSWKELATSFVTDKQGDIPLEEIELENPRGYPNVLKGSLPEFLFVPAVRDVNDEAKVQKTNPFGQLINSVLEKISQEQRSLLSAKLKEIEALLNRGSDERIVEIKNIEDRLNELMKDLMDCDIEIEMTLPRLREVFGETKIYANDGTRTTIERKGHGLQRSMIFTILRAYAELVNTKKAGEFASQRSTIFAIEEPEIYLHPQFQRTFMNVFDAIGEGRDQVFYTTHSSLFVDLSKFDNICIMRKVHNENVHSSSPTQLSIDTLLDDLMARKGAEGTEEGIREHYAHAFNPMINEGFFADKVVIVEGPSEEYCLPIYSDLLNYNLDRNNVAVVHCNGKGQIDRLLRIFNGFKIPTYVWFDGDKNNEDVEIKRKTIELLGLMGYEIPDITGLTTMVTDFFAVLECDLETTLRTEVPDYDQIISQSKATLGPTGKPLKQRWLASSIKKKVENGNSIIDVIPKTIHDIVEKIKSLEYRNSILKKTD